MKFKIMRDGNRAPSLEYVQLKKKKEEEFNTVRLCSLEPFITVNGDNGGRVIIFSY